MAARRVAKSSVDWAKFVERVPPNQKDCFKAFRAKSDMFVSRVHRYPESLPKIDFAAYKAKLPNPAMVDEFQKSFESLNVPYPKDKDNVLANLEKSEQEANKASAEFVASCQREIAEIKAQLDGLNLIPPPEQMTFQMYAEFFPESTITAETKSFWPHDKMSQPQNDPNTIH